MNLYMDYMEKNTASIRKKAYTENINMETLKLPGQLNLGISEVLSTKMCQRDDILQLSKVIHTGTKSECNPLLVIYRH